MTNSIQVDSLVNPPSEAKTPAPVGPAAPLLHLLGIPFHDVNLEGALEHVKQFIADGTPRQICLANAHTVSSCWKDFELRQILDHADLVLADGMSIVWGGHMIGVHLPCRVAGPDFAEALCAMAEQSGYRVFFLGSTPENLTQLKSILLKKWPRLRLAGMFSPPMREKLDAEDNRTILNEIHASKPDILFVGMSMPKQEKWIAANLKTLNVPVSIGIGAAFDFLSGRIPRAPRLLQESGFEWLYRLACEPQRLWKRYLLGNAIFLSHLAAAWIKYRFHSLK